MSLKNEYINIGLNKTKKKAIELLIENPAYTFDELAKQINVIRRTIERSFKTLQEKKMYRKNRGKA